MSVRILRETMTIVNGEALGLPEGKRQLSVVVAPVYDEMTVREVISSSTEIRAHTLKRFLEDNGVPDTAVMESVFEVLAFDQLDNYGDWFLAEADRPEPTSVRRIALDPA